MEILLTVWTRVRKTTGPETVSAMNAFPAVDVPELGTEPAYRTVLYRTLTEKTAKEPSNL